MAEPKATAERAFPAQPAVVGGGQIIASPFQFYTTGEERLRVVSANSLVGVRLKVQARFIDRKGTIQANSWDHVPNSDRTTATSDVDLGVGALLNLTVFAGTGQPLSGQTYVIVQMVRGAGGAAIVLGTLLGGYVTSKQALGWPGSPILPSTSGEPYIRTVTGTDPAAGSEWQESVPTGARWQLMTVAVDLVTGAAVANRTSRLSLRAGGTRVFGSAQKGIVTASSTRTLFWGASMPIETEISPNANIAGIPAPMILKAADEVASDTDNMQAADNYGAPRIYVREWLEVQ